MYIADDFDKMPKSVKIRQSIGNVINIKSSPFAEPECFGINNLSADGVFKFNQIALEKEELPFRQCRICRGRKNSPCRV